jgi:ABC-type phosphonate transport system ATPase subunit
MPLNRERTQALSTTLPGTAEEPLVVSSALAKDFRALRAVDSLDFNVYPGELLRFLGPNGAKRTSRSHAPRTSCTRSPGPSL